MAIKFLSGLNLSNVTAGSILKLDSNGNIVAATAGTDYATSSVWTTSGSNIYYSSGNVTIGASSNSAPLHVYAYQTTDPKFLIEDGNTGDASMQFKISTQQYTMGLDNSDSDKFKISAGSSFTTSDLIFTSDGKLGIGKSPLANFQVFKDTNGAVITKVTNDNTGTSAYAETHWESGTSGNELRIGVSHNYASSQWNNAWVYAINKDLALKAGSTGKSIKFYTNGSDESDVKAIINSDGNVGIGTSTPDSRVHIEATTDGTGSGADAVLHVKQNGTWSANQPWALYVEGYSYLNGFRINASDGIRALHKVDAGGQLGFSVTDTAPITFTQSNSTERMRVHTNGYIGIGTTSPTSTLDVSGVITTRNSSLLRRYVSTWTNADTHDILYNGWTSAMGDYVYLKAQGNSTGGHGMMLVGDNVAYIGRSDVETGAVTGLDQTWATFKNGGVGIGTTSPSEKLEVIGTIKQKTGSGYTNYVQQSVAEAQLTFSTYSGNQSVHPSAIKFSPNGTEAVRINNSGNVGIGTNSPDYKLDVEGDIQINETLIAKSGVDLVLQARSGQAVGINSNGTRTMTLDASNNVGIGTTSPSANLQVASTGSNGSAGLSDYGFVVTSSSTDQPTLGAEAIGDGHANLNLGSNISGTRRFWHISKRKAADSHKLSFYYYNGTGFSEPFEFKTNGDFFATTVYSPTVRVNGTSNHLTLRSDIQVAQGSTDPIIEFSYGTTQMGKFDQDGYMYATGFKTTTASTGFLKADGSVDTTTYANGSDYLALAGGTMTGDLTIPSKIIHSGDTDTYFLFGTNTITLTAGNLSGLSVESGIVKSQQDFVVTGGETFALGERAEGDDNGRTVLIEGAANAANGEGSGRIFFSEHNSTTAAADSYGLSLYYEGDANVALPSGFQPNTGNATWSLRRHNNSVSGAAIMSGTRTSSDVTFSGSISATSKSFDIEHPTKEGKRLVYGSLEGAEHGVYFRGKGTGEVIELPEHWTGLVHENSITVQLTPIGKNCVWVENIKDNSVHVGMDNDTPYFYFIQAERKDIDKLIVEKDA